MRKWDPFIDSCCSPDSLEPLEDSDGEDGMSKFGFRMVSCPVCGKVWAKFREDFKEVSGFDADTGWMTLDRKEVEAMEGGRR